MNVRELIDFYPGYSRYIALFLDEEREMPYWYTARCDAPISWELYGEILENFDVDDELTKDGFWLVLDIESNSCEVLPWEKAHRLMSDFHKEYEKNLDPLDAMAASLTYANKLL